MDDSKQISRGLYFSVAALAGAALMLESTLTRLLAVAQYYHFAFLVVSLALLGFGASGSFLTMFPGWLKDGDGASRAKGITRIILLAGSGFTASLVAAYMVINWLPFDSYSITWDRSQVVYFALYYLVLTLPFLFAGLGIGAVLSTSHAESSRVYAANLLGSAVGILLGLLLMQLAGVPGALLASGMLGFSAILGSPGAISKLARSGTWLVLAAGASGVLLLVISNLSSISPVGFTISPYKALPYALRVPGSEKLFGRWSAISRVDVISGASTHVMPGLSYTYAKQLPEQLGMAFDGDALRPVTLVEPDQFDAASYLPEAAAFALHPGGSVLVLDPGSGLGVNQAIAGEAGIVLAVLDNPLVLSALHDSALAGNIYSHPDVQLAGQPARVYLEADSNEFEVVFLPLNEPYRPVANGAYSLSEEFNLTVQAFKAMLERLAPGGTLVVTRWLQTPPSEELRLLTTLIEALDHMDISDAGETIIAYRGIQTMTYLVQPGGWTGEQIGFVRDFTAKRRFDLVWAPGINPAETNIYNRLETPLYFQQFEELIAADDLDAAIAGYPYAVNPATDDRPFFFHFFKWEQTPEVLATFGRVWQPFGGSGYFVLLALLLLVSVFSMVLILVPLVIRRRTSNSPGDIPADVNVRSTLPTWKVLVYFGGIGIAFLFIEIPLIQVSMLSLGHPAYAFSLVVLVLLVSSSLGSYASRRLWNRKFLVLLLLLAAAVLLPLLFRQLQYASLGWSQWLRLVSLAACLAPLGVLMGFPFPFGLEWLERSGSRLVPWAWAVNGCASVVAAVLAAILSLSLGFSVVLLLGVLFYAAAAFVIR